MFRQYLVALGACRPALEWVTEEMTLAEAWRACPNGAWMQWLLWRVNHQEARDVIDRWREFYQREVRSAVEQTLEEADGDGTELAFRLCRSLRADFIRSIHPEPPRLKPLPDCDCKGRPCRWCDPNYVKGDSIRI
jgi:hypothetical protein